QTPTTHRRLYSFPTRRSSDLGVVLAYVNRAEVYQHLKQYDSAIKDLTQAIRLQPKDALLYKARAEANLLAGKHAQAIEDFSRLIDRKSTRLNSSHVAISYAVF